MQVKWRVGSTDLKKNNNSAAFKFLSIYLFFLLLFWLHLDFYQLVFFISPLPIVLVLPLVREVIREDYPGRWVRCPTMDQNGNHLRGAFLDIYCKSLTYNLLAMHWQTRKHPQRWKMSKKKTNFWWNCWTLVVVHEAWQFPWNFDKILSEPPAISTVGNATDSDTTHMK